MTTGKVQRVSISFALLTILIAQANRWDQKPCRPIYIYDNQCSYNGLRFLFISQRIAFYTSFREELTTLGLPTYI